MPLDPTTHEKVDKLPVWARQLIYRLDNAPATLQDEVRQLSGKLEHLKKQYRKQSEQIEAMVAFFQCAAKGENEIAKAVENIVRDFLTPDSE